MLGTTSAILCVFSFALAFISSGWYVAVVLILLAGLGAYAFIRFRDVLEAQGLRDNLKDQGNPSTTLEDNRTSSRKMAKRPSKPIPAKAANGYDDFAKSYAESLEVTQLPIGKISEIAEPRKTDHLWDSDDTGLLAAIDEIQDDSDADAEFRLIALRVLAGFKTRNSIEAISQIALYDLSSNLRSKAVMMLAELDHESVFETIVLACADPSREVRAAAARALVNVTFDRAGEWTRIALSDDQYMARQVARAAVEAGIAERSFDRLVMKDEKAVYESFALVYLLIKTGEMEKVFEAIREHRDLKTRVALLHVLKVANVAEVIPELTALIAAEPMGSLVADKARETLLGINAMPVEV